MKKGLTVRKTICALLAAVTAFVAAPSIGITNQQQVYAAFSGDYKTWNQTSSYYYAVRTWGCFITAQAKMLYEIGVNRSQMNPDFWYQYQADNGGCARDTTYMYGKGHSVLTAYAASQGYPMTYFGTWKADDSQIWFNINAGYYTICSVPNHFVLIDNEKSKSTGQLYVEDNGREHLLHDFGAVYNGHVYRVDGRPTPPKPAPVQASWDGANASSISETNATLNVTYNPGTSKRFYWVGVNIFDASGNTVGQAGHALDQTTSSMPMSFNITNDTHNNAVLQPGTTYTYQFYVNMQGENDTFSPKHTFTTEQRKIEKHTVTFDAAQGTMESKTRQYDGKIDYFPTVYRNGYILDGWYTSDGHKAYIGMPLSKDITLTARWDKVNSDKKFTLLFNANGGYVYTESRMYTNNINWLPTATRYEYTFDGWYSDIKSGQHIETGMTANDNVSDGATITVYAHWTNQATEQKEYTVTLDANGGNVSKSYLETTNATIKDLPEPERFGYTFDGWYDNYGTRYYGNEKISEDITLSAKWTELRSNVSKAYGIKFTRKGKKVIIFWKTREEDEVYYKVRIKAGRWKLDTQTIYGDSQLVVKCPNRKKVKITVQINTYDMYQELQPSGWAKKTKRV